MNKRITYLTNMMLAFVILGVVLFGFSGINVPIYQEASAIYNGNKEKKQISLMFNVYENTEVVYGIIEVLERYNARCTFFVGGCWADDNAEALKKIVDSGNEVANHGYFHKDHKKLTYEQNKKEIVNTEKVVYALCGAKTTLFAPPSGSYSKTTVSCAEDLGYKVIMWTKDTIDWRDKDTSLIYRRATQNISNGDLILMHPKEQTLQILPKILEYYANLGYNAIIVSDNIK